MRINPWYNHDKRRRNQLYFGNVRGGGAHNSLPLA